MLLLQLSVLKAMRLAWVIIIMILRTEGVPDEQRSMVQRMLMSPALAMVEFGVFITTTVPLREIGSAADELTVNYSKRQQGQ